MQGLIKLVSTLGVLVTLAAAGLAIWNNRDKVKQTWDSLGGAEGVANTVNKLVESAGPVRDLVNQMSHLK